MKWSNIIIEAVNAKKKNVDKEEAEWSIERDSQR